MGWRSVINIGQTDPRRSFYYGPSSLTSSMPRAT